MREEDVRYIWELRASGLSLRAVAAATDQPLAQVQRVLERRIYQEVEIEEKVVTDAELTNLLQRRRYMDKVDAKTIGEIVTMNREGRTQVEIAEALGISQPSVSNWLRRLREGT